MNTLIERAKSLILSPKAEWDKIEAEPAEPQALTLSYVAPLVAVGVVASMVGALAFGDGGLGGIFRPSIGAVLTSSVVSFALSVGGVFVLAFIVSALAPTFGAAKNYKQAFKLAAYAGTPAWLAQIVTILPQLGVLALVGALYALYLFFLGLPKLMKPAPEKATNYAVASIGAAIGLAIVAGLVAAPLMGGGMAAMAGGGAVFSGDRASGGSRGAETRLEEAAKDMERAAEQGDIGGVLGALGGALGAQDGPVVRLDALRAMAPEKLVGLDRTSLESTSLSAPFKVAQVSARYEGGDRYIELEIANSPAIMLAMGFAGAATPEYERETDDGYERLRRQGDGLVVEEWSRSSGYGKYGRLTAGTFMVTASGGGGIDMADLKRAVESFSEGELKRLPTAE